MAFWLNVILALVAAPAQAETAVALETEPHRHVVYADIFGKGGLYGLGYELRLDHRFAVGAATSFVQLRGTRTFSLSPYLACTLWRSGRHSIYADLGPQLVYVHDDPGVPEWDGDRSIGIGGQVTAGYEHRRDWFLARGYLMVVVGKGAGHVAPWAGGSVGVSF